MAAQPLFPADFTGSSLLITPSRSLPLIIMSFTSYAQKPLPSPKTNHMFGHFQAKELWGVSEEGRDQVLARSHTVDMPKKTMANQVPSTPRRDDKNPLLRTGNRLAATIAVHSLDSSFEKSFQDNLELRMRISTLENKIRNRKLLRILLQKREQEISSLQSSLSQTLADISALQSPETAVEVEDWSISEGREDQEDTLVSRVEKRAWRDPWPRLEVQMETLRWKLVKFLARRETQPLRP